jgi:SAM-dependent methyltransferase
MSEGYDAAIFAAYAKIEDRSFWFRARNRLIIDFIRRDFGDAREVLEVGCGDGFALLAVRTALPEARLVGIEPFTEGIEIARRRVPTAEFVNGVVEELDFRVTFDLACAFDVLEHLDDDEAALNRIHRALKPGGGLLLFVPQHPRLWSGADDFAHHRRRYTKSGLLWLIERAGFDLVLTTSFVSALLPALVAARALQRVRRASYEPVNELVPPFGLNRLFEAILDTERLLIGRGARFPVGGTLVVVARARPPGR